MGKGTPAPPRPAHPPGGRAGSLPAALVPEVCVASPSLQVWLLDSLAFKPAALYAKLNVSFCG